MTTFCLKNVIQEYKNAQNKQQDLTKNPLVCI